MGDELRALQQRLGITALYVTHDQEEAMALSDRVVVMSAGPSSRILADHRIELPRPRETNEIRLDARFHAIQRAIWNDLRGEVMKAYGDLAPAGDAA